MGNAIMESVPKIPKTKEQTRLSMNLAPFMLFIINRITKIAVTHTNIKHGLPNKKNIFTPYSLKTRIIYLLL